MNRPTFRPPRPRRELARARSASDPSSCREPIPTKSALLPETSPTDLLRSAGCHRRVAASQSRGSFPPSRVIRTQRRERQDIRIAAFRNMVAHRSAECRICPLAKMLADSSHRRAWSTGCSAAVSALAYFRSSARLRGPSTRSTGSVIELTVRLPSPRERQGPGTRGALAPGCAPALPSDPDRRSEHALPARLSLGVAVHRCRRASSSKGTSANPTPCARPGGVRPALRKTNPTTAPTHTAASHCKPATHIPEPRSRTCAAIPNPPENHRCRYGHAACRNTRRPALDVSPLLWSTPTSCPATLLRHADRLPRSSTSPPSASATPPRPHTRLEPAAAPQTDLPDTVTSTTPPGHAASAGHCPIAVGQLPTYRNTT